MSLISSSSGSWSNHPTAILLSSSPKPHPFQQKGLFSFHRENSGQQCKLQLLTNPQIQCKCNSTPFLSVVDTVCASLTPFRTEGLSVCSRHPSAVRSLWGLPQLKKPALPKAMPPFQAAWIQWMADGGIRLGSLTPTPSFSASHGAGWGLCQTCSADQWLPPPIPSLPWLVNPRVLSNKHPACWSPSQIGFSANPTWNALFFLSQFHPPAKGWDPAPVCSGPVLPLGLP